MTELKMKRYLQVHWMDRKGAGRMRSFGDQDECAKFLDTLRCEAEVMENGEKVGSVERPIFTPDDKRFKWVWWLEKL